MDVGPVTSKINLVGFGVGTKFISMIFIPVLAFELPTTFKFHTSFYSKFKSSKIATIASFTDLAFLKAAVINGTEIKTSLRGMTFIPS